MDALISRVKRVRIVLTGKTQYLSSFPFHPSFISQKHKNVSTVETMGYWREAETTSDALMLFRRHVVLSHNGLLTC